MKFFTLLLPLFLTLFTVTMVAAHPNPQFRVCNERDGEFVAVDVPFDQMGLCKVGSSYVGAVDLMNFFYEKKSDLSIANYSAAAITCPVLVTSHSLEGLPIQLCIYEDNSIMDYKTVINSRYSIENLALNQFLGIID